MILSLLLEAPGARVVPGVLGKLVRPLDLVRRALWRLGTKTRLGRDCVRDRGLRLFVLALAHMGVTLALTLVAPLWLLLLGPIILGFPHVVSDVRYLLVKPVAPFRGLDRTGLVLVLGPLAAMTLLRVLPVLGVPPVPFGAPIEVLLGAAAIVGALCVARLSRRAKALSITLALGLGAFGAAHGHTTSLVIAHAHNLVAFGLWLWMFSSEGTRGRLLTLAAAYLGVMALTLGGAFDGIILGHLDGAAAGLDLDYMVWSVAPAVEPMLAMRLVLFYAFAQAIHYVVWLRLVPQRLDDRPAPPTFSRSIARLRGDLGRWGFWLVVVISIATPLATLVFEALDVRLVYLLVVIGHGWLELAVLAALGAERATRSGTAARATP
ncbi:MAG: hypothetical protein IT385_01820 [Deltaproteobacteria bacterium]|nr:hypothetical protein [Deltaproteobacteria bacterium]